MHVRDIAFNAFASFALPAKLEDADPHVNVVIGRNGAGKSNVFLALRYVLSGLDDRDPRAFVFRAGSEEGRGAFAEVVLHDGGHELALHAAQVRVGRATTRHGMHYADRYKINGRKALRETVRGRLALSGLGTPAEQLFIVPQGQSTRLAAASSAERLQALLALCGADAYDRSVASVQQLLETSEQKLARMHTQLGGMDDRLDIVQRELDFLRAWLEDQAELRGIALVLYTIEMRRTDVRLSADRAAHSDLDKAARQALNDADAADVAVAAARDAAADAEATCETARLDLSYAQDRLETQRSRTRQLESLRLFENRDVPPPRQHIDRNDPNFHEKVTYRRQQRMGYEDAMYKRDYIERAAQLYAHATRGKDQSAELSILEHRLEDLRQRAKKPPSSGPEPSNQVPSLGLEDIRAHLDPQTHPWKISGLFSGDDAETREKFRPLRLLLEKSHARKALTTARTVEIVAQRSLAVAHTRLTDAEDGQRTARVGARQLELAEERLERASLATQSQLASRDALQLVRGVGGVRTAAVKVGVADKYFGTVADLIDVAPSARLAAERIAGLALYDHVVDCAATASRLASELSAANGKLGGATFVPLRELSVPPLPACNVSDSAERCSPLLSQVSVPTEYQKVADVLFGRAWLCPDLDTAQQIAQTQRVTAVTVDGDICRPGGTMQVSSARDGGNAPHDSRLMLVRKLGKVTKDRTVVADDLQKARERTDEAAQGITAARTAIAAAERAVEKAKGRVTAARNVLLHLEGDEIRSFETTKLSREKTHAVQVDRAGTEMAFNAFRETLETGAIHDFAHDLAQASAAINTWDVEKLTPGQIRAREDEEKYYYVDMPADLRPPEAEKLFRKACAEWGLDELADKFADAPSANSNDRDDVDMSDAGTSEGENDTHAPKSQELLQARRVVKERKADVQARRREASRAAADAELARQGVARATKDRSTAHTGLHGVQSKLSTSSMRLEALEKFRAGLAERSRKLRNVPDEFMTTAQSIAHETSHTNEELRDLTKEMEERAADARRRLSERGRINMAAAHAYERYASAAAALRERYTALLKDHAQIVEARRGAGTVRAERVAEFLAKVQAQFPPMLARLSNGAEGSLEIERAEGAPVGVGFSTVFADTHLQLSGGQKTLTSLALMFAAHAVRPVPFFVLDEIDANLDSGMRAAVARTVAELSRQHNTQFFCTTFSEELVEHADATWAVTFENEHSEITRVEPSLALDVVRAGGAEELPPALRTARDQRRESEPWDNDPVGAAKAGRGTPSSARASSQDSAASWRELGQVRVGQLGEYESSEDEDEDEDEAEAEIVSGNESDNEGADVSGSANGSDFGEPITRRDAKRRAEELHSPPKVARTVF